MGSFKGKAILEIGSAAIRLSVVRQEGDLCYRTGFAEQPFSGYENGAFTRLDELIPVIKKLISTLDIRFNISLSDIIVGVPSEFISVVCKSFETDIVDTVTAEDVDRILAQGDPFVFSRKHILIETRANYYKTDYNPNRLTNPIGERCSVLKSEVSYMLCDSYFCVHFEEIARILELNFTYVSIAWSEFKMLADFVANYSRKNFLLFNLGENASSVSYSSGDGLVFSKAFSLGVNNITKDLSIVLDIPQRQAESLTEVLNFNLKPRSPDKYVISIEDESFSREIELSNAVAAERIKEIATYLLDAIEKSEVPIEKGLPVYFTGTDFCKRRGVNDIFESVLGRNVELIEYNFDGLSSPKHYSLAALMYVYGRSERVGFLSQLSSSIKRYFVKIKK